MSADQHLILVESDASRSAALVRTLNGRGYRVTCAVTGREALARLDDGEPDLLLISGRLADMNGLDLLERIRRFSGTPIIIITDTLPNAHKVHILEMGADDVIARPYDDSEMLARVAALLRRVTWSPQSETVLKVGKLRVEMSHRRATMGGQVLHLTPIEFSILCTLMQRAGQLVTYEELLDSVWGSSFEGNFSVLRVNISRLRQKIESNADRPQFILTVPRQGYRMPG